MKERDAQVLQAQIAATYGSIVQSEVIAVGKGRKSSGLRLRLVPRRRVMTLTSLDDWESVQAAWGLLLEEEVAER